MPMRRTHSYFPLYTERTLIAHVWFCYCSIQACQLMRGCGTQLMDHNMRPVGHGRLQILLLESEVDRLKKRSVHKYALLVSKKITVLRIGPLGSGRGPRIAESASSVVTPLSQFVISVSVLFGKQELNIVLEASYFKSL